MLLDVADLCVTKVDGDSVRHDLVPCRAVPIPDGDILTSGPVNDNGVTLLEAFGDARRKVTESDDLEPSDVILEIVCPPNLALVVNPRLRLVVELVVVVSDAELCDSRSGRREAKIWVLSQIPLDVLRVP